MNSAAIMGFKAICVVRREPDVSEGFTPSFFRVEEYTKQETRRSRPQAES
jgi:hypothetical protein